MELSRGREEGKEHFGWSCRLWGKKRGTTDKEGQRRRRNGVLPRTYAQYQKTARAYL
jgi:hypothetical protein